MKKAAGFPSVSWNTDDWKVFLNIHLYDRQLYPPFLIMGGSTEADRFSLRPEDFLTLKKKYDRTNVVEHSFFHRITD